MAKRVNASAAKKEAARDRKRRQRERQKSGDEIYRIALGLDVVDGLARAGFVHPSVADEPQEIEAAIVQIIKEKLRLKP